MADHVLPVDGCAASCVSRRARANGYAPSTPTTGGYHGGRSPVVSAVIGSTAPLLGLQRQWRMALEVPTTGCAKSRNTVFAPDPPDLDADFPVASRSVPSDLPVGLPLLGFSKDRPSIVRSRGVRRPGSAFPRLPSGVGGQPSPRAVLVVSHHLDGFSSSTAAEVCALLPILGFAVFPLVAKRSSSQRSSCPSKLSLRRQRRVRNESVRVGLRHGLDHR